MESNNSRPASGEECKDSKETIKPQVVKSETHSEASTDYEDSDASEGKISDDLSIYSTNDPDIIHQRKKEKHLKKRFLIEAIKRSANNDTDSIDSFISKINASVGTSIISVRSFRALNNLAKFDLEKKETIFDEICKTYAPRSDLQSSKHLKKMINTWRTKIQEKKYKQTLQFEPTYCLDPIQIIRTEGIFNRCQSILEKLISKNFKYDALQTPKFLKIACEILKHNIKLFVLDRYKILLHGLILQKVSSQSCQVVSACLWNESHDKKLLLKMETDSYFLIFYIFLVYSE